MEYPHSWTTQNGIEVIVSNLIAHQYEFRGTTKKGDFFSFIFYADGTFFFGEDVEMRTLQNEVYL
jgi:hypothetical protein